jgi:hypothetical protein
MAVRPPGPPSPSRHSALSQHAPSIHTGFLERDPDFTDLRSANWGVLCDFLAVMDAAGRPGLRRKLGSTILQLTGQPTEHYWATVLADDDGHRRQVLVFDDGSHGWGDEISYSDRPRSRDDEIPREMLRTALDRILTDNDLSWPDHHTAGHHRPSPPAEDRETQLAYHHHREIQYVAMMGLRVLCLIAAVVVAALDVPYAPLWIGLLGLGMIFLPLIAVMVANDHYPRRRREMHHWFRRAGST